eukprot:GILK01000659.1.p1 GENE.GILK01000659.1~~GILK01000659.1.p1  ORF type:complete len:505 (+),score=87.31 GILK01000659.1:204-1517(+)
MDEAQERKERWEELQDQMDAINLSPEEQEAVKKDMMRQESEYNRMKRKKVSVRDFDSIKLIGRGAFGEVRVVRKRDTGEVFALKKMKKTEMVYKNQVGHVRAERDVLVYANHPFVVQLHFSFQDERHLYLVMEYLPGGDLMTLLMRKDILSEDEARFYIAETVLAVDSIHKLGYIHRDLKPDNILLDKVGHIKLSDFGLAKPTHNDRFPPATQHSPEGVDVEAGAVSQSERKNTWKRNRKLAFSTVGTPDYIAPEVFAHTGYGEECDWWSVGVILFEMLVGYPPFYAEDPSLTCQKIMQWRRTLVIPFEARLSREATDLIKRLICDSPNRLGSGPDNVEEIKRHPFFRGIDWDNLRNTTAPNMPEVYGETDTRNFDDFSDDEDPAAADPQNVPGKVRRSRKDNHFIGYTFKREVDHNRPQISLESYQTGSDKPAASK